jgi:hypothetical protein
MQTGSAFGTGLPDPSQSHVDPCLVICPDGDFDFYVVIRDINGQVIPAAEVCIDLTNCPEVALCNPDGSEGYTIQNGRICAIAADGSFTFRVRGGGTCPEPGVVVYANDVPLRFVPVASPDQDGNFAVEDPQDTDILQDKFLNNPTDPTADFNCDGHIGTADVAIFRDHLGHECNVPDAAQSSVDPCLIICPEGDSDFAVVVRDGLGNPIPAAETMVDLCDCPETSLCDSNAGDAYTIEGGCKIVGLSDVTGTFTFAIRGGGTCSEARAVVSANGVTLGNRAIASFDQGGNGGVNIFDEEVLLDKVVNSPLDPAGDLDCDGVVSGVDLALLRTHTHHSCPELIDVPEGAPTVLRDAMLPSVPNPATSGTLLRFTASREQALELVILDVRGQLVRHVWSGVKGPGFHVVEWDGRDGAGEAAPPGVYFVRLSGERFTDSTKLVLSR